MAITIFLLLNAMGVVFLLYTLLNFWNEGRRVKSDVRDCDLDPARTNASPVVVTMRSFPGSAPDNCTMIPLRVDDRAVRGRMNLRESPAKIQELPVKRYSAK